MKHYRSRIGSVLVCSALLLALPAGVFAAGGSGQGSTATGSSGSTSQTNGKPLFYGKITAITQDGATLHKDSGVDLHVKFDSSTRFVALSFAAAQSGLQVGEYAEVMGNDGDTVDRIVYDNKDFGQGSGGNHNDQRISGRFVEIQGDALTIEQTGHDPVTVKLTSDTKYVVDGKQVNQRPDYTKGQELRILVHRESDDSLDALVVASKTTAATATPTATSS